MQCEVGFGLNVGGLEFSVNNELQLFWVCGNVYKMPSLVL